MKKRLVIVAVALLSAASAMAELYPSSRYVEFGTNVTFNLDQNLMGVTDIFKTKLVIDLPRIANDLGSDGFIINAGLGLETYFKFDFKKFGFGLSLNPQVSSQVGLSQDFFNFLAYGNGSSDELFFGLNLNMQAFANVSVPVKFSVGQLKFRVTPTYFLPLVYVPQPKNGGVTIRTLDNGVSADVDAEVSLYTVVGLQDVLGDGKLEDISFNVDGLIDAVSTAESVLQTILQSGGIDLGIAAEMPLWFVTGLDVGAYAQVPIKPGYLRNRVYGSVTGGVVLQDPIDGLLNNTTTWFEMDEFEVSDIQYESGKYVVNRPFRLGAEAAWRPFGTWFTLRPQLGIAYRNPFGFDGGIANLYPEYRLSVETTLLYVLGIDFATEYTDKVFANSIGLRFNARVFEMDVKIASSSSSFVRSWTLPGAKALVAFKFGF